MSSQPTPMDQEMLTGGVSNLSTYLELLDSIHEHIRHALEDSIRCLSPRARYFHHVEEPSDLEKIIQFMTRKTLTITPTEFASHISEVIKRAVYEICEWLHQREGEMFFAIESLHQFLDDTQHSIEDLGRQADQTNAITQRAMDLYNELGVRMKLTEEQEALLNTQDEPDLERFVQDSVDLAFREDPRGILTLESATGFLEGVQKAATSVVFQSFNEALNKKINHAFVFWAENLHHVSVACMQRMTEE